MQSDATCVSLPRGGSRVRCRSRLLQVGVPPETIKDTMLLPGGVPDTFVLGRSLFDLERAVSVAELEFPIYYHFFVLGRRVTVVCEAEQRPLVLALLRETLFPPASPRLAEEFLRGEAAPELPDLERELAYFQRHPRQARPFTEEDLIEFVAFSPSGVATLGAVEVVLDRARSLIHVREDGRTQATVPWDVQVPIPDAFVKAAAPFVPPLFGVTALGTGSGFDPADATSGFVIWINRRGISVDPPVDSNLNLREERISPRLIQDVILTHCHADHDAGVLQKVLEEGLIRIHTTPTIMEGFIRKARLITGLTEEQLRRMIDFCPVRVGVPVFILGGEFRFHYNFHSVPTFRFEVRYQGKRLVYSSDIFNIPEKLQELHSQGIFSAGRLADLLAFPWDADLIIHEAGMPPLHTPPAHLATLAPEILERLYVVHTTEARVKPFAGLRMMGAGIEHTLSLPVEETPASRAQLALRTLAGLDLLKGLSTERAADLLRVAEARALPAGAHLIRRGQEGHELYLIMQGEVSVIREQREYKVYGAGDVVGDMAMVSDEPRFSDVVARSSIEFLAFRKPDFVALTGESGTLDYLHHLAEIRRQDSWPLLDESPVFAILTVGQRTQLQALMVRRTLCPGTVLLSPEQRLLGGWLLIGGSCDVLLNDTLRGHMGRGCFVGQLPAPGGKLAPTLFTVVVREEVDAYEIRGEEVQSLLERNPGMWLRLNLRSQLDRQLNPPSQKR